MSLRYKGAVISATPPTVSATSPDPYGTAKGVWTLQQQLQYEGAGTWPNPFTPSYVEDVFSTYLYTGNNTNNRSFTNNIDLSGDGGLVWIKSRGPTAGIWHGLFDTARGANKRLVSNNSDAEGSSPAYGYVSAFNADGFTVTGGSSGYDNVNLSNENYASWTFRKAEKFFDVVNYTGNGVNGRTIAHSLGSTPGCVIVKRTDTTAAWIVRHRAGGGINLLLNTTAAGDAGATYENGNVSGFSSTTFTVSSGSTINAVNANGGTYVAYLFAHDAGGFGANGTDNVITCGSMSGTDTITLGYEPQWIMVKRTDTTGSWWMMDIMRGIVTGGDDQYLVANTSGAEGPVELAQVNATGFQSFFGSGTYIYIAIRRGPMKTPESGTSVFAPVVGSSLNSSFVTDFAFIDYKPGGSGTYPFSCARLNGNTYLKTSATSAELPMGSALYGAVQNGIGNAYFDSDFVGWLFQRAPGFMDVVCYTGTGVARTVSHNLSVAPELMIVKSRTEAGRGWAVYAAPLGATKWLRLELTNAEATVSTVWNDTAPTSSVFTVGVSAWTNNNTQSFVNYLFATCPGVSKVGSYTGTGTTLQVNCGFTGGARFVLIKRTDSTGDWYVWDSARGIVAGNDPYLLLNSTAAEVTNTDYVDTYSAGFEISSTAPAAINANGGTFIFLAIA